jgi:ABC-type dipeptide/oligopeptide/nickel transport system permease component
VSHLRLVRYIIKRLLSVIPVLIGVTILTFTISHIIPGDPVRATLGPYPSAEAVQELKQKWGMDRPVYVQYFRYMKNLVKGDLGTSFQTSRAVKEDLEQFFPATFELTIFSLIFALLLGIPLGIIAATKRDRWIDHGTRVFSLLGVSMPIFWLGLILILLLYLKIGLFPAGGRLSSSLSPPEGLTGFYLLDSLLTMNWTVFRDCLWHILMPSICLAFANVGVISRMTRSSMLDVLNQDFIRTAEAKGLPQRLVIYKHALRNAMIPVITIVGVMFGRLIAGAVLTETIFSWPGMGLYTVQSILYLDFQPIMGFTMLVSFFYVCVNLLTDILYGLFDPRVVLE